MFNGDLTPLKDADVTFTNLQTPDGRHFAIETDATERTTKLVHMTQPEEAPRRSLGQRISAMFHWTKRETPTRVWPHSTSGTRLSSPSMRRFPLHPQELWAGTPV